mgnify:CR=1 FL=1
MNADPFVKKTPAKTRYGYGNLEVGEEVTVDLHLAEENVAKIRSHLAAYSAYYNKRFVTRVVNGILRIMRVA